MTEPRPSVDARTVTVRLPIAIRRCGGRKLVLAPDGAEVTAAPVTRHVDNAMVKAPQHELKWVNLSPKNRLSGYPADVEENVV